MTDARTPSLASMPLRIAVALAQGALLWRLFEIADNDLWPPEQRGWLIALSAAGILLPLAYYVLADLAPLARLWPALAGLALLSLGLGWHHGAWTTSEPYRGSVEFVVAMGVLVFHAMPFLQSALTRGVLRPRYEVLFHFAWRNALLGALGAVFTGVFWLLLMVWGQLFRMLGIDAFHDLFQSSAFAIPATAVAVSVGVQLAGSVERLQGALRQQLLTMLKWLAPLAILILVLFSVALVATSAELFTEQRRAISALWLLWLVALTVALLNAAYQDGGDDAPYPRWLGTLMRVAVVLLLPVALLAIYAIAVRISAYGLTAERVWGVLVAVVACAYAAGYAWAALRRGPWMAGMGIVNVSIAFFTIVALTLMLTPLVSPERLAARSQEGRVLADPAGDAYAELRFRSGRYGRERLAALSRIEGHAQAAEIRRRAGREIRKENPWTGPALAGVPAPGNFVAFPAGAVPEPQLIAFFAATDGRQLASCSPEARCPILFTDLNRDGADEALFFGENGVIGATRGPEGWEVLQRYQVGAAYATSDRREETLRALESGAYRVGELPWQTIEIAGETYVWAGTVNAPAAEDPAAP
jgi:hypothetical protein